MNLYRNIKADFASKANTEVAIGQKAYMKGQFEYYGLKSPIRNEIQKPYLVKSNLPQIDEAVKVMKSCFKDEHRELQYFGMELMIKYQKQFREKDIEWIEWMILEKSWWDTVDLIASKIAGAYFKQYPEQITGVMDKWLASKNIWLQRTALLFQLKYKNQTDKELLAELILSLVGSKEFFINKAIGWVLREYGKTNPDWVVEFIEIHEDKLAPLSKKEALRRIS